MQDRLSSDVMDGGAFRQTVRAIVGRRHVHVGAAAEKRFASGYRFGGGEIELAATPGTLVEMWRLLKLCAAHGRIVIIQAANTGLTGGSTPLGPYDRPVVIIGTLRLGRIHLIGGGVQVVCLAGATLDALEAALLPLGREPHSVIGSSCIGASVVGGVCNNSGGALIRRGPAYTELALYAQIGADGGLCLVNHLGVRLSDDPEEALRRIECGDFSEADVVHDAASVASAHDYETVVRAVDAPTPARFNADAARLFEAAGSAGRIAVFAVRLDTFAREAATRTFYIGTNAPDDLTRLRRTILTEARRLPISAEYLHRDAFDLADRYGKDTFLAVRRLGTARLPALFASKRRAEAAAVRLGLPGTVVDRAMQWAADRLPDHLPRRMREYRDRYAHHLILTVSEEDAAETDAMVRAALEERCRDKADGAAFVCSPAEADAALLHRFVTAGAAVRYRAVHAGTVADVVALDVALRRDDPDWFAPLPENVAEAVIRTARYGHFFCHVFHLDHIVAAGHDPHGVEERLLAAYDARGAEYPAEHNVGHLYRAKPALAAHYRALDPTNQLNPGIGMTSRARDWR